MFPPHESSSVGVFASRCWNSCANLLGGSRSHFIRIKLPNRSSGSKNRHDGHANLESSPRDFRADFGLRRLRRAGLARRINCWTQASKVLGIERAQGCRDSRPDPDDPFFYAWPKHRDPKFTAKN
jgi:hypothetical protein